MPGVVRKGDRCSGHAEYPPRPNLEGSPDVFVNGIALHRVGDNWLLHTGTGGPHAGHTQSGSASVFCNGKAVARIGDPVSVPCLSRAAQGSSDVFCG